jgi:hypothetical protein
MRSATNMAWDHGGADFSIALRQISAQAEQMKEGALRVS